MDPFIGEIRMFAGNFEPVGWAFCNGQLLAIQQNTALFALLGTFYGGDGRVTFALPNLQERIPLQAGQGSGLSRYDLGQSGGQPAVTLLQGEMPTHSHGLSANSSTGTTGLASSSAIPAVSSGPPIYRQSARIVPMNPASLMPTGAGQPHNNWQPFLVVNFIIALQGIFPSRA
jgi:microcystin-dependent protein